MSTLLQIFIIWKLIKYIITNYSHKLPINNQLNTYAFINSWNINMSRHVIMFMAHPLIKKSGFQVQDHM